jgi:hypothetical protein
VISSKRKESRPNAIDEKQFNPMLMGLLEVQGMITSRIFHSERINAVHGSLSNYKYSKICKAILLVGIINLQIYKRND